MSDENRRKAYYQQALLVAGVLAGILFVALIFVFEDANAFRVALWPLDAGPSFHALVTIMGSGCAALAASSIGMMLLANGEDKGEGLHLKLIDGLFMFGLLCFASGLWITMYDITLVGAGVVTCVILVSFLMLALQHRTKNKNRVPDKDVERQKGKNSGGIPAVAND